MAKAEIKTKKTDASVDDFLDNIADEKVRDDSRKIAALMEKATGAKPKMWGAAIVGFGERHLKYASGRDLDWMEVGFAPRKANLTLYLNIGEGWDEDLLSQLGKHKVGMGCLYFKRLSDVNEEILEKLIEKSVENIRKN
ncbi:MAG TPA: DUF1801 domain-containing protein [Pyrinomonadaceae bacterium]|jgi:hypothetical protein|nr:DUF1801 domain-containing protein [Pyrinomonadaceae bacterium]